MADNVAALVGALIVTFLVSVIVVGWAAIVGFDAHLVEDTFRWGWSVG